MTASVASVAEVAGPVAIAVVGTIGRPMDDAPCVVTVDGVPIPGVWQVQTESRFPELGWDEFRHGPRFGRPVHTISLTGQFYADSAGTEYSLATGADAALLFGTASDPAAEIRAALERVRVQRGVLDQGSDGVRDATTVMALRSAELSLQMALAELERNKTAGKG